MSKRIICAFGAVFVCIIMASCSEHREVADIDVPEGVTALIESYMNAYKTSTEEAAQYAHFESDFKKQVYIDSGDRILDYKIESAQKISDELFALTILLKTKQDTDHYLRVYNFVARINNIWYYINGVGNIPPDLKANLNEEAYTYGA